MDTLIAARDQIGLLDAGKTEAELKTAILTALDEVTDGVGKAIDRVDTALLKSTNARLAGVSLESNKNSTISPRFSQLVEATEELVRITSKPAASSNGDAQQLVVDNMPSFVYYFNYGNLDSEIYLPHVIENMERPDLGGHEEAKARTLKVLFEFVKLKPAEIWELKRCANY